MASTSTSADVLHIVSLSFKDGVDFETHLKTDLRLKERMPDLVESWCWRKNLSLSDRDAADNKECQVVVIVRLKSYADVAAYLVHEQHKEVGAIQAPLLKAKHVIDVLAPAL